MTVPDIILAKAEQHLPDVFHLCGKARLYNLITGAGISHFDLLEMSVLERDQIDLLIDNADLII